MFEIRSAKSDEFETAVKWAQAEGWNPGLDDLTAFYQADPNGFLIGLKDGEIVSSISVVKYGADLGFLGFYIVRSDARGTGLGLKTWQAGIDYLNGRTIGLDGVVEQQDNYLKSGFSYAYENIRYQGKAGTFSVLADPEADLVFDLATNKDLPAIMALDLVCFGADRASFIEAWTMFGQSASRITKVAYKGDQLVGFGTLRKCVQGYKIGPLFADDKDVAANLIADLAGTIMPGQNVMIDMPKPNLLAIQMAETCALEPVFSTARMYRGPEPKLNLSKIFGITTFELG